MKRKKWMPKVKKEGMRLKKLALYKFSTSTLGLPISGGISNPKGHVLMPFSNTYV
jgi:hypothetical protein